MNTPAPDHARAKRAVEDVINITLADPRNVPVTVSVLTDLMLEFAAGAIDSCKGKIPEGWTKITAELVCDERAAELRAQKRPLASKKDLSERTR